MKLTVFGPSGGTGKELLRQALAAGHEVTAVARRPEAVPSEHSQLRVVGGDIFDATSLRGPIAEADAVLSALGSREGNRPTTVYSAGTTAILTAMREEGVHRVIAISAAPIAPDEHKTAIERRVLTPVLYRFFGGGYDDMHRMENLLTESDRDWTVFRPPRLTNKPRSGHYRTALDAPLRAGRSIPRANLAAGILDVINHSSTIGHTITIAT
jgi:putative NADH-flavin reductase